MAHKIQAALQFTAFPGSLDQYTRVLASCRDYHLHWHTELHLINSS